MRGPAGFAAGAAECWNEPEQETRPDDREDDAVGRNQREPQAAVGQLLHDRREDGHGEEEGDERSGPARIPAVRDQPLLFRGVEVTEE